MLVFEFASGELRAQLDAELAPATCAALTQTLQTPVTLRVRHAMFTGPEMSMQLPAAQHSALLDVPPEAAIIMPTEGQVLFTPLAARVWLGSREAILDIGIFYGPYGRTFFPSGWLAGNAFARILPEHHHLMKELGRSLIEHGAQEVTLRLA
ncbi:anti-sigma factor RsiW [Deinococcus sp. UYEF24]